MYIVFSSVCMYVCGLMSSRTIIWLVFVMPLRTYVNEYGRLYLTFDFSHCICLCYIPFINDQKNDKIITVCGKKVKVKHFYFTTVTARLEARMLAIE